MAAIIEKTVRGRKYRYVAKSIRLPDGTVKTIQKIIRPGEKMNGSEEFFGKREKELFLEYALRKYRTDSIFTREEFGKVEDMRVDYRHILRKLNKNQLKDVFDRFTANFTYESNAMEGNSLTLKDVAMVMFDNLMPSGKNLREVYETRNSRKVIELIMRKKFRLEHADIIRMHKMLMKDIDDERTGYKTIPNYLVGRTVETAPPEKVEDEMSSLLEWANKNPTRLHPLQLSADFHGRFEKIHPFEDGNGRVGRFLSNVVLVNNGYPPLIIRKSQRVAYMNTLEKFDNGHAAGLERFFLEKFKDTYRGFFGVYVKYAN